MVNGFTKFKERFQGVENQYVIIGGTACDLIMENEELPFRATKDVDIVLIVESITAEFGRQFWEYVKEAGYIEKTQVTEDMVFAGETALSKKTMLNPNRVATYAISEKDYDTTLLTEELIDPDKQVRLELWAYDPKYYSENNSADDISVILSFENTNDERIEEAVDELLERRLRE